MEQVRHVLIVIEIFGFNQSKTGMPRRTWKHATRHLWADCNQDPDISSAINPSMLVASTCANCPRFLAPTSISKPLFALRKVLPSSTEEFKSRCTTMLSGNSAQISISPLRDQAGVDSTESFVFGEAFGSQMPKSIKNHFGLEDGLGRQAWQGVAHNAGPYSMDECRMANFSAVGNAPQAAYVGLQVCAPELASLPMHHWQPEDFFMEQEQLAAEEDAAEDSAPLWRCYPFFLDSGLDDQLGSAGSAAPPMDGTSEWTVSANHAGSRVPVARGYSPGGWPLSAASIYASC